MGIRKFNDVAQAAEPKKTAATFFDPASQHLAAADGSLTNDPETNEQPQARPRREHAPLRAAASIEPHFELSTHRAIRLSTPEAQAQRAAEVAVKQVEQAERQRLSIDWLMNLLAK